MNSITSTEDFETLTNITLANPHGMQGGAYFSKLAVSGKPLLIQTPKCSTKNGIHVTDKKTYCDLMFTEDDDTFLSWIEELQSTIKQLIYEKRDLWFHNEMDLDSIDYHWQNALRVYKQRKTLLRCFLPKKRGLHSKYSIQIFDEDENQLTISDIKKDTNVISILEINGLKFTSQSFQLECTIRQMMTVKEEEIFSKCLIQINKPDKLSSNNATTPLQNESNDQQDDESDSSSSSEDALQDQIEETVESKDFATTKVENTEKLEDNTVSVMELNQSLTINNNSDEQPKDNIQQSNNTHQTKDISENNAEKSLDEVSLTFSNLESSSSLSSKSINNTISSASDNTEVVKASATVTAENSSSDNKNNANTNNMENVKQTILKEVTDDILSSLKNQEDLEKNLDTVSESLEKTKEISEVNIEFPNIESDSLTLKKLNEVYMEIYKEARKKAKDAKKAAVQAYLEAKRIKSLYLLDEIESSEDEFDINEYTD